MCFGYFIKEKVLTGAISKYYIFIAVLVSMSRLKNSIYILPGMNDAAIKMSPLQSFTLV